MKIDLKTTFSLSTLELSAIPVSPAKKSAPLFNGIALETRETLKQFDKEMNGELQKILKRLDYRSSGAERMELQIPRNGQILPVFLAGISAEALKDSGIDEWRKLGGAVYRATARLKLRGASILLRAVSKPALPKVIEAVAEGIRLAQYEFQKYKSGKRPTTAPKSFTLILRERPTKESVKALKRAEVRAAAVTLARDLVNTPPLDMLPKDLVTHAREVKRRSKRARLKIFGPRELKRMRANLLLAVSAGSASDPYLIHLTRPAIGRRKKKIVLVGKGVTFDSGGLSIKPGKGMEDMKCDMAGAAAVLAAFQALSQLDVKGIELHAVVPTTENSVSALSTRPGDIIRSMNGKTVEILNTDAEGRLILADALTYCEKLKPDLIVDLATLTGACIVALGDDYAGLFTSDEKLRNALLASAKNSGELLWPLPLAKEYRGQLKGQTGDLRNIGNGSGAGATIGALFLEEFVPNGATWAHLDIAGPAFLNRGGEYSTPGATGYGVRTLVEWVEELAREEAQK